MAIEQEQSVVTEAGEGMLGEGGLAMH